MSDTVLTSLHLLFYLFHSEALSGGTNPVSVAGKQPQKGRARVGSCVLVTPARSFYMTTVQHDWEGREREPAKRLVPSHFSPMPAATAHQVHKQWILIKDPQMAPQSRPPRLCLALDRREKENCLEAIKLGLKTAPSLFSVQSS